MPKYGIDHTDWMWEDLRKALNYHGYQELVENEDMYYIMKGEECIGTMTRRAGKMILVRYDNNEDSERVFNIFISYSY